MVIRAKFQQWLQPRLQFFSCGFGHPGCPQSCCPRGGRSEEPRNAAAGLGRGLSRFLHLLLAKTQLEATPCHDSLGKCFFISLVTLIDKYVLVFLLGTELYDSSCLTCCAVPEAAVPAACTGLSVCPSVHPGALGHCRNQHPSPALIPAPGTPPSRAHRNPAPALIVLILPSCTARKAPGSSAGTECAKSSQVLSGLGALYLQDDTFSTENVGFGYGKFKSLFGSTVSKSCVLEQESQFWFSFSNGFLCCLKCPE